MYQQREEVPEDLEIVGLWQPAILTQEGEPIQFDPEPSDGYGVVDEMIADDVRLALAPWPLVDVAGRLRFQNETSEAHPFPRQELQVELDARRVEEGQLPRPLRIGDAFLVRGFGGTPAGWNRVLDITGAARPVAKRAGLRAVSQVVATKTAPLAAQTKKEVSSSGWRRLPPLKPRSTGQVLPPEHSSPGSSTGPVI
jgi:hypothetical protein